MPRAPLSSFTTKEFETGISILSKKKAKKRVGMISMICSIKIKVLYVGYKIWGVRVYFFRDHQRRPNQDWYIYFFDADLSISIYICYWSNLTAYDNIITNNIPMRHITKFDNHLNNLMFMFVQNKMKTKLIKREGIMIMSYAS